MADSSKIAGRLLPAVIFSAVLAALVAAWLPGLDGGLYLDSPRVVEHPALFTAESPTRPIATLSYALNSALWGADPAAYRGVDVALHLLAALGLFLLLRLLLGEGEEETGRRRAAWAAAAATLIWAAHPAQVQTVLYVAQRTALLAGLCGVWCLYLFCRSFTENARRPRLLRTGAALLLLLALGSKETALAWAPAATLLALAVPGVDLRRAARAALPLWILAAAAALSYVILTLHFRPDALWGAAETERLLPPPPYGLRLLAQPRVVVYYASLLLWPAPARLSAEHDFPLAGLASPPVGLAFLFCLAAVLLGVRLFRRRPLAGAAILWFLAALLPEALARLSPAAEQRLYAPSMAVALGAGLVFQARLRRPERFRKLVVGAAWGAAFLALCFITARRGIIYLDPVAFYTDAAAKAPFSVRAQYNLGVAQEKAGRLAKALEGYEAALDLAPENPAVRLAAAGALRRLGRREEALAHYRTVVARHPDWVTPLEELGATLIEEGRYREATAPLAEASRLNPDDPRAAELLGKAFLSSGRSEEALEVFTKAAARWPDYPPFLVRRGVVLRKLGRLAEAEAALREAVRRAPDSAAAWLALSLVLEDLGRPEKAREAAEKARKLLGR